MDGYTFSLAGYDDIPEIVCLYNSLVGTPGCDWSLEYPNSKIAEADIDRKALYILKKDDKIIAAASAGALNGLDHLQWSLKRPCELSRVAVSPMIQKQGIGTMIMQNIMNIAKEQGFDGIRMVVGKANFPALALYDKYGFEKCGELFMHDLEFYCYQLQFDSAE